MSNTRALYGILFVLTVLLLSVMKNQNDARQVYAITEINSKLIRAACVRFRRDETTLAHALPKYAASFNARANCPSAMQKAEELPITITTPFSIQATDDP